MRVHLHLTVNFQFEWSGPDSGIATDFVVNETFQLITSPQGKNDCWGIYAYRSRVLRKSCCCLRSHRTKVRYHRLTLTPVVYNAGPSEAERQTRRSTLGKCK
jgi:hypothetical protein